MQKHSSSQLLFILSQNVMASYTVRLTLYRETSCFNNSPLLTWSGNELQEAITWIRFHPLLIPNTVHSMQQITG